MEVRSRVPVRARAALAAVLVAGAVPAMATALAMEAQAIGPCICPCTLQCLPDPDPPPNNDPPSEPLDFEAAAGPDAGEIHLAWEEPIDNDPLTHYEVFRGTAAGDLDHLATVDDAVLEHTDTGLPNGATRYYAVRACNNSACSDLTDEESATTFDLPGAPLALAATRGPARGEIGLSWSAPSDDGGTPVTGYRVYGGDPGGALALLATVGAATSWSETGLADGAARVYAVSAENLAGEGPRSAQVEGTAPVLPGAPSGLATEEGPGAGQITLTWTLADDGGTPVQKYLVFGGDASGALGLLGEAASAGFTESGLPAGKVRYYQVRAVTLVGEGPRSGVVEGRAPVLPGAPRNLQAVPWSGLALLPQPNVGGVRLTWEAASGAVDGYRVYRGTASGQLAFLRELGPVTTWTDTTASFEATYHYRLVAFNAAGEGPPSNEACAAPFPWLYATSPPLTAPCPLPAGWHEELLLAHRAPLPAGAAVPGAGAHLVHLDAGPRAGSPYYDVRLQVLGAGLGPVAVPVYGLVAVPVRADLLHVPGVDLTGAALEVEVLYRHDPAAPQCVLRLAGQCLATNPAGSTSWLTFRGAGAALLVHARLVNGSGAVLAEQWVTVPFAGQALAAA